MLDTRPLSDASFVTIKGQPVDCKVVDCGIFESAKGNIGVRVLLKVVKGVDVTGRDVSGELVYIDRYFTAAALPYTLQDLRVLGWSTPPPGAEIDAIADFAGGPEAVGLHGNIVRVETRQDPNSKLETPIIKVASLTVQPVRLTRDAAKAKLKVLFNSHLPTTTTSRSKPPQSNDDPVF